MLRWKTVLIGCSLFALVACSTTIIIKDEGVKVIKVQAGASVVAPVDGWFMSDQAIIKMLDAEIKCKAELDKCRLEKDR